MSWNIESPKTEYYDHTSRNLEALIKEIADTKSAAIDTETTGLNTWKDIPLYWSLAFGTRRMTLNASVLPFFKQVFNDPDRRWILCNAKYDQHILANVDCPLAGHLVDISVKHGLLYEERPHGLKDVCQHLFGWRWLDFQDTFGKIGKLQSAEELIRKAERTDMALLAEYAANDAWGTLKADEELTKQLAVSPTHSLFRTVPPYIETMLDYYEKLELPYTRVLWKNERNGILINEAEIDRIKPLAEREIEEVERAITKAAGTVLNPRSTAHLKDYFIEKQKLKPLKMTNGGKSGVRSPSVNVDFLEHYESTDPVAALVLRHRSLSKLHGTYIVGLKEHVDPKGRLHTTFNQNVARTGRLSSSSPNLQQIPKPEKDKWGLRKLFIAPPGEELLVLDYEQLEMRLLAIAAQDEGMCESIRQGRDIHMSNAERVYGIPYDDFKKAKKLDQQVKEHLADASVLTEYFLDCLKKRGGIKTVGFGIIYGMGESKLANELGISREEAKQIIEDFAVAIPAIAAFTEESVAETVASGYAFSIMGRRRNVPEIMSLNRGEQEKGKRIAKNHPIQASAADVVRMAQLLIDRSNLESRYGCKPLLQIHDELVFQCPTENAAQALDEIQDWMEHPFYMDLQAPLAASKGRGSNWLEAK